LRGRKLVSGADEWKFRDTAHRSSRVKKITGEKTQNQ